MVEVVGGVGGLGAGVGEGLAVSDGVVVVVVVVGRDGVGFVVGVDALVLLPADDFAAVVVVVGVEGVLVVEGGSGHDDVRSAACWVVGVIILRDRGSRKVVPNSVEQIAVGFGFAGGG